MPSSLTIRWEAAQLPEDSGEMGHGFCIFAGSKRRAERLVAFVEGFTWLRGGDTAVVLFDPQLLPSDEQQLAAFKAAVEARLRAGRVSPGEIVPGYWGIANA